MYYDCLDGGLWVIVCEMVFVGYVGVLLNVDMLMFDLNYEFDYGDVKDWVK